jgi:hypothetical protein
MTNGELYEIYAKQTGNSPVNYIDFNIKLRSLYSNMYLIRTVPEDSANSHDHVLKVMSYLK